MSEIRVDNITNEAGTGKPGFPNGITATGAALTDPEITGGIYLGGTGSANYLEDYEEGTWNPEWNVDVVYRNQGGTYVKVGKTVFAYFDLQTDDSPSTSTDRIQIINLPFTPSDVGTSRSASGFAKSFGNNWDSGNQPQWFFPSATSPTAVAKYESNGQEAFLPSSALSRTTRISGTLIYGTDS